MDIFLCMERWCHIAGEYRINDFEHIVARSTVLEVYDKALFIELDDMAQ